MTIIKRVVDALRANGRPDDSALADELLVFVTGLKDSVENIMACYQKQGVTMKKLINVMMARCPHHEWYLGATNHPLNPGTWGPEDTIVCYGCGHTVCDERAFAFGKRVKQGDYFIYSKANGRRFGLSVDLKKKLGDKLKVKEISDGSDEERLRSAGDSDGESQAAGRLHDNSAGAERHPADGDAQGDGCAVAGTDPTSV